MKILLAVILFTGTIVGPAAAQQAVPQAVPPTSTTVPEWVVRYAGNQEQAVRACQLQLAQEQTKIDSLQKDLADAKNAAAAASRPATTLEGPRLKEVKPTSDLQPDYTAPTLRHKP